MRIAEERRQVGGVVADERDIVHAHVVRDDLEHGIRDLVEAHELALRLVLAGEAEQAVHDLVAANGVPDDVVELVALLGVGARGLEQLGEADDGGERVVKLVGDAGDKLADGGKFFALEQLGLRGLERADGLFEIGAGSLQVPGHVVEGDGDGTAFVVGEMRDAAREVAAADGLGVVAQHQQRLGHAPDEVPDDQPAEEDAGEADGDEGGAGAGELGEALLEGGEQHVAESARGAAGPVTAAEGEVVSVDDRQHVGPRRAGAHGSHQVGRQFGLADRRGGDGVAFEQHDVRSGDGLEFLQGVFPEPRGHRQHADGCSVLLGGDGNGRHQVGVTVEVERGGPGFPLLGEGGQRGGGTHELVGGERIAAAGDGGIGAGLGDEQQRLAILTVGVEPFV